MPQIDLESPLVKDLQEELTKRPKYSDLEETYLKGLRKKMESARDARDTNHDEFDGMDYVAQYELNERFANTYIAPKRNKEDTNFQSGTIRQKLFALLSALVNLNLSGDISAFDNEGLEVQALGDAMEDVILKTNELDNDDEKKYLRQYELLKHGTVFVEELWDEKVKKDKKLKGKFDGKIKGVDWTTRIKKAFARPTRNILPGLNVYLGDITKYGNTSEQPFIFTVDTKPYEEAKMIFGEWERWDNVPKKLERFDASEKGGVYNSDWRLIQGKENYVEILRYQDKWNNEFAVVINGVLMTPVGLPLPWGYEDYNIVQQNLEPIHVKFAYGKSLVSRIRNKVALLDEMMRLAVLKTQKSFMPPYLNVSGRILSNRVFMPGKITHGVPANTLIPVNEKDSNGVTNSELAMIQEIQESINSETTSPTFSGQQSKGDPTATEIIELQRQAKMVLGLTVFAMTMLEWKLEWLRLQNVLKNWFNEEDKVVDGARGVLKSKFRIVTTERPVEGEGMGRRMVIPTKEIPSTSAIRKSEDALSEEQGVPIRLIFLNPDEIKSSKLIWQIVVKPKERKTSETEKLMFRAYMQDIQLFGPTVNLENLQEEFASVWGKNPKKAFNPAQPKEMNPAMNPDLSKTLSPKVNLPTPEKNENRRMALTMA